MSIVMKCLARVDLPDKHKQEVLGMYLHYARNGDYIKNYKYSKGVAYLPLNFSKLQYVARLLGKDIVDQRSLGGELAGSFSINPSFKFRDHQGTPAATLLYHCQENNYGVLSAGCGNGKTVVMTWVAGMLGRKVLVLVDMGSLQSQWKEAFEIVWNKESCIIDRDTKIFPDVCIVTFQLLHSNPQLLTALRQEFGTILLDEFHSTQSDTRREILMKLDSIYRIGCSATMMKKNFSDDVLTDMVSGISVVMKDENELKANIVFLPTGRKLFSSNPDDFGKIISKLGKDQIRNALIADTVTGLVDKGRKVLVIGSTIEGLKSIEALLLKNCAKCKARVYTGSTTLKQDQALKADLASGLVNTIMTIKKADRGLDLPALDCLVLTKPANNEAFVVQISGRIVRSMEGKPTPLVIDLVDSGSLAEAFAKNRKRWYVKKGYKIVEDEINS